MIVSTHGRVANSDADYRATEESEFTEHSDRDAREPRLRQRVGNRDRCAPGSRPRLHRRRDDVRQGAGAVDVPHQRRRGPRADDGALLHAEQADDSASVGRDVRRVSAVPAQGSGREPPAQSERPESTPMPDVRSTAAAASSRTSASTARSRASARRASAGCSTRGRSSPTTRRNTSPTATRASRSSRAPRKFVKPNFVVDDAMMADFRQQLVDRQDQDRRGRVQEGPGVHQGDDPLRDRHAAVRRRGGAAASDRGRSAGAGGARDVRRSA